MKILIIGSTGTIGKYVAQYFLKDHEVIGASRSDDLYPVNIADKESIGQLFKKTGKVDAIICAAGEAKWGDFQEMTEEDFYVGIKSKLMGQVNLVRIGQNYLEQGGSITLTTGILADDPVVQTTSAAMVNGAIHSFVKAVNLEMTDGNRINVVSTGVVENAYKKYQNYFPGHIPIPMNKMIKAYIRSVEGKGTGQVIRMYE